MSNSVNERILQSYATPLAGSQIVDSSWVIALVLVGVTIALIPVFLLTVYIGLSVKSKIRQLRKPTTITPEPYEAKTVRNSSLLLPTMEMLKGDEELKQMDTILNNENESQINIIWPSHPKQHQKRINIHLPPDSEYPEMMKTFKPVPRLKREQARGLKRNSLDTIISIFQKLSSNNEPANQGSGTNDAVLMSYERPKKGIKKCKEKALKRNQILPISLQSSQDLFRKDDECNVPFQSISTPQVQNYSGSLEDDLSAAASGIFVASKMSPAASPAASASSSSINVTTSELFKQGARSKGNKIDKNDIRPKICLVPFLMHPAAESELRLPSKIASEVLTKISKNTETLITPSELAILLKKTRPPTPTKTDLRNKSLIWLDEFDELLDTMAMANARTPAIANTGTSTPTQIEFFAEDSGTDTEEPALSLTVDSEAETDQKIFLEVETETQQPQVLFEPDFVADKSTIWINEFDELLVPDPVPLVATKKSVIFNTGTTTPMEIHTAESETETEGALLLDADSETETDRKFFLEAEVETEPKVVTFESEVETDRNLTLAAESETVPKFTFETGAETDPKSTFETESETVPKFTFETEAETDPKFTFETEAETEPKATHKSGAETDVKGVSNAESDTDPKVSFEADAMSETDPVVFVQEPAAAKASISTSSTQLVQPTVEASVGVKFDSSHTLVEQTPVPEPVVAESAPLTDPQHIANSVQEMQILEPAVDEIQAKQSEEAVLMEEISEFEFDDDNSFPTGTSEMPEITNTDAPAVTYKQISLPLLIPVPATTTLEQGTNPDQALVMMSKSTPIQTVPSVSVSSQSVAEKLALTEQFVQTNLNTVNTILQPVSAPVPVLVPAPVPVEPDVVFTSPALKENPSENFMNFDDTPKVASKHSSLSHFLPISNAPSVNVIAGPPIAMPIKEIESEVSVEEHNEFLPSTSVNSEENIPINIPTAKDSVLMLISSPKETELDDAEAVSNTDNNIPDSVVPVTELKQSDENVGVSSIESNHQIASENAVVATMSEEVASTVEKSSQSTQYLRADNKSKQTVTERLNISQGISADVISTHKIKNASQSSQFPQLLQTESSGIQAGVGVGTRRGRGIGIGIGVGRSSPRSLSFSSVTAIGKNKKNSLNNLKCLPAGKVRKDSLVVDQAKIGARIAEMDWLKKEEELFLDRTAGALAYLSLDRATIQLLLNKDDGVCPQECGCQEPSGSQQKKK